MNRKGPDLTVRTLLIPSSVFSVSSVFDVS
jgi:hypothetical protein